MQTELINTQVVAGRMETIEKDGKKVEVFVEKKRFIVETCHLAAMFRRDHELAAMPIVKVLSTNMDPDHGQFFATNRGGY
jgi:hypothetical protein